MAAVPPSARRAGGGVANAVVILAALLLVVGPQSAAAARVGDVVGARPLRRRRPLAAAAAAAASLAVGGGWAPVVRGESGYERVELLFGGLDADGDGALTLQEYTGGLDRFFAEASAQVDPYKVFAEADITGDERLQTEEFLYAQHLCNEAGGWYSSVCERLMPELCRYVDELFKSWSSEGGLGREEAVQTLGVLFGHPSGRLPETLRDYLREKFGMADVTGDGVLSSQELQFFRLLLRDGLLKTALPPDDGTDPREAHFDHFFSTLDVDGDGRLSQGEVVTTVTEMVAKSPANARLWTEVVRRLFRASDVDGDESLDKNETRALYNNVARFAR